MKQILSGEWQFALDEQKKGIEKAFYKEKTFNGIITLPTTTAEAKKGEKGTEKYTGYLTETYHFEGYAWYLREIEIPREEEGKRFFFSMERTRKSTVWVDGEKAGSFNSFYIEHRYELTKWLTPGKHTLTVMIDNTDYLSNGGHMTSPDTQTNWNGILGEIYLESTGDIAIDKMLIYPSRKDKKADIKLELSYFNDSNTKKVSEILKNIQIRVNCKLTRLDKKADRSYEDFNPSDAQNLPYTINTIQILEEKTYNIADINEKNMCIQQTVTYPLGENAKEWNEYEPNVYEAVVSIMRGNEILCEKTSYFGLRDFTHNELKLCCNDKEIFLRGTHDALIFPLTGYAPMDLSSWIAVYGTSKEYGLNHYRYHTCCPPKAAFLAASYLGIYVQAELAFWGSIYAADDENYNGEQQDFLLEEGLRALDSFGDMPSYFGMSMGNELWGSKEEINKIMGILKAHDNRHLYTQGSNNHQFVPSVLPNDDFFSGVRFSKYRLFRGSYAMCDAPLGFVQTKEPGAYWCYDEMISPKEIENDKASKAGTIQIQYGTGIKEVEIADGEAEVIPHVPVISHEIGQYEFTPDFNEIELYTGVLQPENLKIFRERMEEKGLLKYADKYFKASGRLASACYKLELEAAFRSENLSGFQLLDIKDYSGQGTALVGILNAFNKNKGIVSKEEWRSFCSDAVLLPTLESFVMKGAATIKSEIKLRYYRPNKLEAAVLKAIWYQKATDSSDKVIASQEMLCPEISGVGLFTLGEMQLNVPDCINNAEYTLRFELGSDIVNEYDIFVYNEKAINNENKCCNDNICITNDNKKALEECAKGKTTLLFVKPESVAADDTIQGDYCTDFWCYPMFRSISEGAGKPVPIGTMGLLIDNTHPALKGFASHTYTTPQWYHIITNSRPMILDKLSDEKNINPIVRMMDNFERNHNLGLIYEAKGGKLIVCHADLIELKDKYPEAACLYNSLVDYVLQKQ